MNLFGLIERDGVICTCDGGSLFVGSYLADDGKWHTRWELKPQTAAAIREFCRDYEAHLMPIFAEADPLCLDWPDDHLLRGVALSCAYQELSPRLHLRSA